MKEDGMADNRIRKEVRASSDSTLATSGAFSARGSKSCDAEYDGRVGPGESLQLHRTLLDDDIVRRELRFVLLDDLKERELNDDEVVQQALMSLFLRVNELTRENPDIELDLNDFIAFQNETIDRLQNENSELTTTLKEKIEVYDELNRVRGEVTAVIGKDQFIDHLKKRLKVLLELNNPIDAKMRSLHKDIEKFVPEVRNLIAEVEAYRQSGAELSESKLAHIEEKTKKIRQAKLVTTEANTDIRTSNTSSTRGTREQRKKKNKKAPGEMADKTRCSDPSPMVHDSLTPHQACNQDSHPTENKRNEGEIFNS